jgi:ketosteroid isomerase-like protein
MLQENVEIVRQVYEAAARRDSATVFALYDEDVELDSTRLNIPFGEAGSVVHGHDGARSFFREWHEAWEIIDYDYDELIDVGDDHVIAVVTRRARGRASGADVKLHVALLFTIRRGKIVRLVWFPARADALEAAGLSE